MRRYGPRTLQRWFTASSSSRTNLIQIRDGTFYREHPSSLSGASSANPPLFPNLTFELPATPEDGTTKPVRTGGHWAIIDAQDTSTFLDILRGNLLCVPPTARTFPHLASDAIAAKDLQLRIPSNAIQYVGFNTGNKAGLGGVGGTQGAYLSARYESRREETDWTVLQHLRGETELNPSQQLRAKAPEQALLDRVVDDLRLRKLLDMPVSNLSNGQTRRCRIAKALLNQPECLLLDEPFMGLDPPTLVTLSPMLRELAYKSDPLLVLGLRPQDPVPDWITDLVVLGKDHSVAVLGEKNEILRLLLDFRDQSAEDSTDALSSTNVDERLQNLRRRLSKPLSGVGDILTERGIIPFSRDVQQGTPAPDPSSKSVSPTTPSRKLGKPLIELQSIVLSYGTKTVLGHKTPTNPDGGLTLSICEGTRLALIGPNGSGKTTLLSLLTSDHPQSYSLPIKFFSRTRLPSKGTPGLSLWEIQSRIGHSAPEVHAFYPKRHSIRQVLESAWAETYSARPQFDTRAKELVDRFLAYWTPELRQHGRDNKIIPGTDGIDLAWASDQETHRFNLVPFGVQRLLLLLRSIIKSPDIIILDEAFSGLDSATREKAMAFLEHGETPLPGLSSLPGQPFRGLQENQALVVVSHVREEVPNCVDEWVRLPSEEEAMEAGKDVLAGRCDELAGGKGLKSKEGWASVWGM